tara:strand:- start:1835 stop:2008 length:174 start_codon:yes stop_codon:yes gene_type:complete
MSKPTAATVKAQIDTHEAVCSERWRETIIRIKRLEAILIGTAAAMIGSMAGIIYKLI